MAYEVNFDGIVGPTHNYSGLSYGNIASMNNEQAISNPQEAALQGLYKMKELMKMGLKQGVLPPHERPYMPTLKALGFTGSDADILKTVHQENPKLLLACSSAACMWTANAGTTSPSLDSADHRLHFTPANLTSKFHRSIEPATTSKIFQEIFKDPKYFEHHPPLFAGNYFSDEGAANHTRLCNHYGSSGIQLFVYGRHAFKENSNAPKKFPARQTYEASEAIQRLHKLDKKRILFAQQNPEAIDAGAFHNDVISVGNQNVFFYHELAFVDTPSIIQQLKQSFKTHCGADLICIEVKNKEVSLNDAVSTYLFNSQLVTLPDNTMALIAPTECKSNKAVNDLLEKILKDKSNPIQKVHFFDLKQSMRNGGGPACLRFRVVMTTAELNAMNQHVLLNDQLYDTLCSWVKKHYRTHLQPNDLTDPKLLQENRSALDELTQILHLGPIYSFNKEVMHE